MEQQKCVDDSNYSSPVPLIGLYIAGATLVCLLFILLDIFIGFRNRKQWLPCRYFSLNSVTLTLLAIATKLPVDLTTSMPSVEDQLSKLTGTTLICTCMGFFMPSLGANSVSDGFSNMTALSIFTITVVVNICIQMRTGVIILFQAQHIIIMCCMMLMLTVLWFSHFEISNQKELSVHGSKEHLTKGTTHHKSNNILHRLKLCYLDSYNSNSQFVLCRAWVNFFVCSLSILYLVVLAKVVFGSLLKNSKKLDFCGGISSSDYGWSMRSIVISQIITIFVGGLASTFRLLIMVGHAEVDIDEMLQEKDAVDVITDNLILRGSIRDSLAGCRKCIMMIVANLLGIIVACPYACAYDVVYVNCVSSSDDDDEDMIKEFEDLIGKGDQMGMDKWTLKKGVKDMKRWIEINKTKTSSINNVVKLLSKTPPSSHDHSLASLLKSRYDLVKPRYKISSLSIVILVRIAIISIPSSLSGSLLSSSLDEVFKIVCFVDRKMSTSSSFEKEKISRLAKALWASYDFNTLIHTIAHKPGNEAILFPSQSQSQLNRAIAIIRGLKEALPSDFVWDELGIVVNFILQNRAYGSIEELYGFIEQLSVDMLNEFLIQLPNAIYKEVVESPPEDFEERVRFALKILFKVEQLEGLVQWLFPGGSTITRLVTDEVSNAGGSSNATNGDVGEHAISMP